MPNSTPVSSVTSQIKVRKTSTASSSNTNNNNNTGLAGANIASNVTNKTLANKKLKTHQLNENEIPKTLNSNSNKTGTNKFLHNTREIVMFFFGSIIIIIFGVMEIFPVGIIKSF